MQTERLALSRATEADLEDVAALHADPAVMRFIDDGRPVPSERAGADLAWLSASYGPGRGYRLARRRGSYEFLGWFGLRPDQEQPDVLELGYRLRPSAWGQGLATEGARFLVRHAFEAAGAQRVFATTMTVHAASRRVLEQAGLSQRRTFFLEWPVYIPGAEHGDVEYALDRGSGLVVAEG